MYSKNQPVLDEVDSIGQQIFTYQDVSVDCTATSINDPTRKSLLESFLELIERPGEVLDVGCGVGNDVLTMTERGIEAVGIDLCDAVLAKARAKTPNCIFRRMDFRSLKYPPGTFAGVWARAPFTDLAQGNVSRALNEFARVLKTEGALGITIPDNTGDSDHQSTFCALIERAGFRVLQVQPSGSNKAWTRVLAVLTNQKDYLVETEDEFNCVLCPSARFKFNREVGLLGSSSILWADNDIYVIPDIAPLVEGHLLIATTSHRICFGDCPESLIPKLYSVKSRVRRLFQDAYSQGTLFFEHGPARCREGGACIEHAHWHCLPVSLPIRQAIANYFGVGYAASLSTLKLLYQKGQSYLYVEDGAEGWVYPVDILTSQFLRQIVALLLGKGDWRWQTSCKTPETQTIYMRTLDRLLPLVDSE